MVKRTAPIRVVSLIVLAACGAMCQKRPSADLLPGLQLDGSISPEVQRQEISTWRSLPDAPSSVQPPSQAERFHALVNEARSPSTQGAVDAGAMRGTELGLQPRLIAPHKAAFTQEGSSNFVGKSTYPPLLKPDPRYYASMSNSFIGAGLLRGFAHFYHARRLRKREAEHSVLPRRAVIGRYARRLPSLLGAIYFEYLQQFWFDDWQRRGK